jgi:4'-phosphopantetheinyl transferase EntD
MAGWADAMVQVLFDETLAHGRCVGVALPEGDEAIAAMAAASLLPEEREAAAALGPVRRRAWVGGRAAMREALARIGATAPPILADERGAPVLPAGLGGSISHKEHVAVALVATGLAGKVGIDVEVDAPRGTDIAAKVLRPEELAELAGMGAEERARAVLLRFSAKEAVYKALDPYVKRYVGFLEIAVTLGPGGEGAVTPHLRDGEGGFAFEVRWMKRDGLIVTTARVTRSRERLG